MTTGSHCGFEVRSGSEEVRFAGADVAEFQHQCRRHRDELHRAGELDVDERCRLAAAVPAPGFNTVR